MKKNYLILLLLIFGCINAFGQFSWERLFSNKSIDAFRSVREVSGGGGYIAAGYIADSTANDSDAYVVRLDLYGDTIWTFTYNGPLSQKDLFYKIIETTDGGFIACGYTTSITGLSDDIFYIKLNSSGQFQWTESYGGTGKDRAQDIIETSDGYTIAGYTTSPPAQYYDALLIHTDFNGNILWTKTYGASNYDDANCIKLLTDGGYLLGGQSNNGVNGFDQFLIRTDISGDTIWTKRFGTLGTDNIESIALVPDGFALIGNTNTLMTGDDGYLVKTDTAGVFQWSKIYGDTAPDDFHSIENTLDGGFILCGTTSSYGPQESNLWLMKTNSLGDSIWTRTFGGDRHDHGYSAVQTSDSGYILAGYNGSCGLRYEDGYIVKLGPDGTGTNHLTYITALALETPLCSGSATEVKVVLWNFGNTPVSNIPVHVEITGGLTLTLDTIFSGPLNAQDLVTIIFSPSINTSGVSSLTINGSANVSNDVYPSNNSFTTTLSLSPCAGIDEIPVHLGFTLYPNPVNGYVVADFSGQYKKANIELINSTGAIVKTLTLTNTSGLKKTIDMSSLAKGLYLFKVSTDEGFDVRRIVLE